MLKENLGRNLKLLREMRQWTQEFAAEICDLSPRYWRKLERGDVSASIHTIEKISTGMDMPVGDLLSDDLKGREE